MMTTQVQDDPPTVLVVDDDEFSLNLIGLTLGQLGFTKVQFAYDGKEGLRAVDKRMHAFDLVICDIFMPNTDGIEFVTELVKRGYGGDVVLVSGGNNQMLSVAHQLAVDSGLNVLGAFAKPLQVNELRRVLSDRDRHQPG